MRKNSIEPTVFLMYSFLCSRMGVHHPEPQNIDRNIIFVSKISFPNYEWVCPPKIKHNLHANANLFFFEIEDVFTN